MSIEKEILRKNRQPFLKRLFTPSFITITLLLLCCNIFLIYQTQKMSSAEEFKIFDPFSILGLSADATDKEIKSAFRKLSLL